MYNQILKDFSFSDENILACFPYGSRVYGTNQKNSDYDFILVLDSVISESDRLDSKYNPISITIYSESSFKEKINEHKISLLECLFCPKDLILKNKIHIDFILNKSKLRHSISEKCSKDWNQAKKRFLDSQGINPVTGERYIRKVYEGKKSLFHCFRMLDFATQIISYNKIVDFASCNSLWEELYTDPSEDWDHYKELYYSSYNNKLIDFRKIAPK